MSQSTQAALPDTDVAYSNLFEGVQQEAFFQKIAAIRPQYYPKTQKQAAYLLDIAAQLEAAEDEQAVKQAEEGVDPFFAASTALSGVLKQAGYDVPTPSRQQESVAVKQAADRLALNPTIYNSVLAMKVAEADRVRQQLGV